MYDEGADLGHEEVHEGGGERDLRARLARAEAELDELRHELAAERRLAGAREGSALQQNAFFAMASHELRTPLQSLGMQLAMIQRRVESTADEVPTAWLVSRLERAVHGVDRLRRLIDGLLGVTHIVAGRLELSRERLDLVALTAQALDRASDALAWAGCAAHLDVKEPVVGEWDRLRLELVLDHLISNAIKFARGRPITVAVRASGDEASLVVSDAGPGIAPEHHARVFERYEKLEPRTQVPGFGLGLWIVRAIAEAHGGSVRLDSTPGRGATFTVRLPLR